MVKQALKRHPGFSESYHGFRSFGQLLEEAQARGLLQLELDEKSGGYIIKSNHQELFARGVNCNYSAPPSFALWRRCCDARILTYCHILPHMLRILRFSRLAREQNPGLLSSYSK